MNDHLTEFSTIGDCHFDALAARFPRVRRERLAFEHLLPADRFEQIRTAAAVFLSACLGSRRPILSEPDLVAALLEARGELANLGPTGQVVPKRDHILHFGLLHQAVAAAFSDFALADVIDTIDLPFSVRMVYGHTDDSRPLRPYSSVKPHTDVWAGVPPDAMVVVLPIFGDIENITIEFGELHPDDERTWMRRLDDFDEGRDVELAVPYHDIAMKLGHLYVADARLMHRTVRRRADSVRVSIDFRFRLHGNQAYREVSAGGQRWELERAVSYDRWLATGRDHIMLFDETLQEARANQRTSLDGPDYGTDYTLGFPAPSTRPRAISELPETLRP